MLIPISNTPRDYSWGSTDLIARLQGRTPTGRPEAEIWYGDHPGSPSQVLGAGDEDFLFDRCRLDFRSVQFPADEGTDGAAARGSRRPFSHTGETAQAVDDVGVPAFHDFLRRFGIGQQLPGHVDDVGFP